MSKSHKAGVRVGDWFLWIDAEIAKTENYRRIPLVTVRKAVVGGDIIQTCVATREMAKSLRIAADNIEAVMDHVESRDNDNPVGCDA